MKLLKEVHPDIFSQLHPTLNAGIDLNNITTGSLIKIWWICSKTCPEGCRHIWDASTAKRCTGRGCPYCAYNRREAFCIHESVIATDSYLLCILDSENNPNINLKKLTRGSNKEVNCICPKGTPYKKTIDKLCRRNERCPCCSPNRLKVRPDESIVHTHPTVVADLHPTLNHDFDPLKVGSGSKIKAWFNCQICTVPYYQSIQKRCIGQSCPNCINKTEAKLLEYLRRHFADVQPQFRPDWCKNPTTNCHLPFDFCIPSLKLLLELDGAQHFRQVANWTSHMETQKRDVYKMITAQAQGYSVIRLLQEEVYDATDEWLNELLLPHLTATEEPEIHTITKPENEALYAEHQRLLESGEMPTFGAGDEDEST